MLFRSRISVKSIVIGLIVIVLVKFGWYYRSEIEDAIGNVSYDVITRTYEKRNLKEMRLGKFGSHNKDERGVYFLGRKSCVDCRDSIYNISKIKKEIEGKYRFSFYYVKLPDRPSVDDEKRLKVFDVDEIPILLYYEYFKNRKRAYKISGYPLRPSFKKGYDSTADFRRRDKMRKSGKRLCKLLRRQGGRKA